jgi:hypothetical protein
MEFTQYHVELYGEEIGGKEGTYTRKGCTVPACRTITYSTQVNIM